MKKIMLLISMILLMLTSCSDDNNETRNSNSDDNNETRNSNASIVGVWKFKKGETLSGKNLKVILETIEDDCSKKDIYEFTETNQYKPIFHYVENNQCKKQEGDADKTYIYDKKTKQLYFDEDEDEDPFDVIELTNNTLIFGWYEADSNNDGTEDYNKIYLYK